MNSIGDRIKELRKYKELTQAEFAKKIGVGQAALSALEKSIRNVTDRNISQISLEFNVSEDWLRTGDGKMFIETDNNVVDQLINEYDLDNLDKQILLTYLELSKPNRDALKKCLLSLASKVQLTSSKNDDINNDIDQELTKYRKELEAEAAERLVCENSEESTGTK